MEKNGSLLNCLPQVTAIQNIIKLITENVHLDKSVNCYHLS